MCGLEFVNFQKLLFGLVKGEGISSREAFLGWDRVEEVFLGVADSAS